MCKCSWVCLGGFDWAPSAPGSTVCPEGEICTPPAKFGAVDDVATTDCVTPP